MVRWLLLPFIVLLLFFSVGNCLPLIGNPQTCQNSDRPVVIICYLLLLEKIACHLFWQIWLWKIKWNEMTSCLRVFAIFVAVFEIPKYQETKILSISQRTDTLIQTLAHFCHSWKNHRVNRAPDVETCREEKINANLLSKFQSLPAEVRETERTTLNLAHFRISQTWF